MLWPAAKPQKKPFRGNHQCEGPNATVVLQPSGPCSIPKTMFYVHWKGGRSVGHDDHHNISAERSTGAPVDRQAKSSQLSRFCKVPRPTKKHESHRFIPVSEASSAHANHAIGLRTGRASAQHWARIRRRTVVESCRAPADLDTASFGADRVHVLSYCAGHTVAKALRLDRRAR